MVLAEWNHGEKFETARAFLDRILTTTLVFWLVVQKLNIRCFSPMQMLRNLFLPGIFPFYLQKLLLLLDSRSKKGRGEMCFSREEFCRFLRFVNEIFSLRTLIETEVLGAQPEWHRPIKSFFFSEKSGSVETKGTFRKQRLFASSETRLEQELPSSTFYLGHLYGDLSFSSRTLSCFEFCLYFVADPVKVWNIILDAKLLYEIFYLISSTTLNICA